MASPHSGRFFVTPTIPNNPSRVLSFKSPLSDETIWKRLHEAGFDEESIKRRDKASLIAHIAKLEAEIYNLQNQMGILIIEKKEWVANYEQMKSTAESAEMSLKLDHASHLSALAESKKREDNLKKALGIEKECVSNIEKALHEMRAECAEPKVEKLQILLVFSMGSVMYPFT
ncbi:hypothetical protein L1887_24538 [Cichorium endivia]|nr:hypothetical protein L1887_24538 [Cichorium endivia]